MLRALVLGAVQGLTEFVPVSSSAHLVLVPFLVGWPIPGLGFDVAVHVGTALAVVAYFRRELLGVIVGTVRTLFGRGEPRDRENARLAGLIALGSIPAAAAGLAFRDAFEGLFARPEAVAGLLLLTAALLFGAEAWYARRGLEERRDVSRIGIGDALVVGVLQAVAIAPGLSRSGSTISAGLLRGLTRDAAARFSFLLGVPAIVGAAILELGDVPPGARLDTILAGSLTAAVFGFAAIAFLLRYLRTRTMRPFAWYCVALSGIAIGFWFQVK